MNLLRLFMLSPFVSIAESLTDNLFRKTCGPIRGSIVYCDLVFGYAEHSGVYIGQDRIVHRNGKGMIEIVSSREFISNTSAITIYVSCDQYGNAVGCEDTALTAEAAVGNYGRYQLLGDNCHQFCSYCLTGDSFNQASLLMLLKIEASNLIGASEWRAWDLLNRP